MPPKAHESEYDTESHEPTMAPGTAGHEGTQHELQDVGSGRPALPIEEDLMGLARLGELRGIQKLFDSGRYSAKSADEQGITALHVRSHQQVFPEDRDLIRRKVC